jgi:hypothetical protein
MWTNGRQVLVRYRGFPGQWHARILLAAVDDDHKTWQIITPDGDQYAEDLSDASAEISDIRDRGIRGAIPYGIAERAVYDFDPVPTAAQIDLLCAEGRVLAAEERTALGLAPRAVAVPPPADGGPGRRIVGKRAAPVAGAIAADDEHAAGGADGARTPGRLDADAGGVPLGGLAELRAMVDGAVGARRDGDWTRGADEGADPVMDIPDFRVLPLVYDRNNIRVREFRSAVEKLDQESFSDFPVQGPRTVGWCARFMLANGGTPRGWHSKWKTEGRLQQHDGGISMHDACCQVFELTLVYDQLNAANLASSEMLCRQIQLVEERWKDRFVSGESAESEYNLHLFLGQQSRGNLCIAPQLQEWISEELKKESSIAKERRKAREERSLVKPPKGDSAGQGRGGGRGGGDPGRGGGRGGGDPG